jgi:isoleucyl-tRNA synthetase
VLYTIYTTLYETLRLLAPICPYITEGIYLNLKKNSLCLKRSIHLAGWPSADQKLIDSRLEKEFVIVESLTQRDTLCKDRIGMGVRWPLQEVVVVTQDNDTVSAVESLSS